MTEIVAKKQKLIFLVFNTNIQYLQEYQNVWMFVGSTRVYLLDYFCSGIQFYFLLSPYLCFLSILYLDLYVLGDDELIS